MAKRPEHKPLVLFAAQVPHDVNMITHSPVFVNHYNIIKFLNENVPDIYQIVVREHPLYKGRYEKEFYNYINEQERIILDNTTPLHTIINNASLVAVNNSTVGIESLALAKEFSSLELHIMIHFVESGALTIQMMYISLKTAITFYLKVSMKFL